MTFEVTFTKRDPGGIVTGLASTLVPLYDFQSPLMRSGVWLILLLIESLRTILALFLWMSYTNSFFALSEDSPSFGFSGGKLGYDSGDSIDFMIYTRRLQ